MLPGFVQLLGLVVFTAGLLAAAEQRRGAAVTILGGSAALILGSLGEVWHIVAPLAERLDRPLFPLFRDYLVETRVGQLALARSLLAGIAAGFVPLWLSRMQGRRSAAIAGGALLIALAYTMAASGHAGGAHGGALLLLVQWTHLIAAALWSAIVAALLLRAWREPETLRPALHRASPAALGAVLVIAASGLALAWLHGLRFEALLTDRYGLLVILKVCLLSLSLLPAAYNRYVALRAQPSVPGMTRRIRRALSLEGCGIAAILLAAAFLIRTPPPH